MLKSIDLRNFKCFSEVSLNLSSLNIFTGLNGMGKSTVIQSLLLYRQSYEQNTNLDRIFLNGEYICLGTGQDLLYENATDDIIRMNFGEDNNFTDIELVYSTDSDVLNVKTPINKTCNSLQEGFEYINAERLPPRTTYEKSSLHLDNDQLGINGQYTAHYLSMHQDDVINFAINDKYRTLGEGVQYWLNEISPNIKFNVSQISNADLAQINYYYTGLKDSTRTREYRPTNVGFGISYVLPVITALLKSKPGSILILDNPEAHLHPQGQRKIGELIAKCAARGVQVFLETHSDHVINGIRISVKQKIISSLRVNIYYFSNNNGFNHFFENPKILDNGRFDYWPEGFFDEWEKALDEII